MRFKRYGIGKVPYQPNPGRRLAAAQRHVEKERGKYPLLEGQMEFESAEARVARLDAANLEWCQVMRRNQALWWLRCRRALMQLPAPQRQEIRKEWDEHRCLPGDPGYLADFLRSKGVSI